MKNKRKNLYRDTDYCNMEKLVKTEKELRTKKDLYRDKVMYVATVKEEVSIATRLCMS